MNVELHKLVSELCLNNEYRIVYHIRPDGDCICSAYALALALRAIGKKVDVVGQDPVPNIHRNITGNIQFDELNDPVYIAVDTASKSRIGSYSDRHFTFCIDHHENNTFGDDVEYIYLEKDCGACCEIIFKIIKLLHVPMTKETATLLYTGIVCDTNCFRTADTGVQTLEIAAELAKAGVDVSEIGRRHTFIKTKGRLAIEEILRKSFHYRCDDRIVTGIIMLSDLADAGVEDSDLEGINSLADELDSALITVTVRELQDGTSRCSMRSKGNISANEICKIHGGGGHFHASCCVLKMPPDKARDLIEKTCVDYLNKETE